MNTDLSKRIAVILAIIIIALVVWGANRTPKEQAPAGNTNTEVSSPEEMTATIPVITTPALLSGKGSEEVEASVAGASISWSYRGVITDPAEKVAAEKSIVALRAKMQEPGADLYDLNLSIAQTYDRIGDGEKAYQALIHASVVDPAKSLAFLNMGSLLIKVKAYASAEKAIKIGVEKEPQFPQTHLALVSFYVVYEPTEVKKIENAFSFALERTGRNETILKEYATWLEGQGKVPQAITAWKEVLGQNPANAFAVTEKIKKLESTTYATGN
ncbi:MAG: hypothetical protein A2408_02280 [Candidatus Yonathbacteria bacterium RIFOXYC1_FULL_52_10]|uniref:Uncharacterized protein n=1 Tax=Candidatus Yonathbacteria bacterium RIFOXYD1_FULL_52_36 TaxID=1802730 RepID=A0A1G2SKA7_9BACT|nr:MAG: hypothetical protein A2408_02280 [Candidatus Yonathbacteria bacterium RIFOXYC1_FULL_52_10]OHA85172.1 MAG: hypothetical protein A2591_04000 [Candidatus Yonathbacteria bacterium RIFOXYD1_FULL_52_36]